MLLQVDECLAKFKRDIKIEPPYRRIRPFTNLHIESLMTPNF